MLKTGLLTGLNCLREFFTSLMNIVSSTLHLIFDFKKLRTLVSKAQTLAETLVRTGFIRTYRTMSLKVLKLWDFLGGPLAKTSHFQ